jgi:hypothetical protein
MSCGRAVVGGNLTSIPEIIDLKEARFDPFDVESIKAVITHALTDDDFRNNLEAHSINRVKEFSWNSSGLKAINALELHFQNNSADSEQKLSTPLLPAVISSIASMSALPNTEDDFIKLAHALSLTFPFSKIN